MKINQPRPSLPVTQPRPQEQLPARPPPRADNDGFETTRSGPVSLGTASPEVTPGEQVIALAKSVMGQSAHDLKLANNTKLGDAMQDWVPDTVNCANFVSGLLTATGQIPKSEGHAGVTSLISNLKKDPNFTQTSLDQARPGDVVAFEYTKKDGTKGHHVVVFEGRDANGQPKFIGSNNVNKDGTQAVSQSTGVHSGWKVLAVMHYSGAPPANVPTPAAPTAPAGPSGPSGAPPSTSVENITTDRSTWLRNGTSGPAVEDLQKKLAAAGFDPGPIDGSFGPKTQAAVRAYQVAKGLQVDGIVGPETRASLLAQPAPGPTPVTPTPPTSNTSTARELEAMAVQKHGPEFLQKVKEMAARLGVKPEWVLAVMKNESGMSTTAKNPNGGATGLIQFMPATARGLGTTTEALSKMSALEQLKYVEKYYAPFKGKINSGTDLYMATFWPAGVGKPDSYNIGGAEVARVNKIFDLDKNGQITAGEFRQYYAKRFPELA
ncbi:MAG: peptidoglycan-binding protein [Archangium sp.]|nr:peptidoglycan-binding protein [Archangium sp.]